MCLTRRGNFSAIQANERELMRAVLRVGLAIAAAGLWLGQAPALAQSAPAATTNTPATDTIGPRELQNFNLQGTVTRSGEPAPASRTTPPAARAPAPRSTTAAGQSSGSPAAPAPARSRPGALAEGPAASPQTASAEPRSTPRTTQQEPRSSTITVDLPPAGSSASAAARQPVPAAFPDAGEAADPLAPERELPVWPWLLAAVALGAGGAFLLWRRNSREALAGGPRIDSFVAPETPAPVRTPQPAPKGAPPASSPKPVGVVSARLRPWIDISVEPLRCIVEETQVRFEFLVSLYNSGSAPARDLLVGASMFNASPAQDREIGAFFGRPAGPGERIEALAPLKRVDLRPQLVVPREQLRVLEAGGRKVFVPLIAFNALYRWSGGPAQTSAAFLLGRDTKGEKLAPFRLDLGPRIFRGLAARALPLSVRN